MQSSSTYGHALQYSVVALTPRKATFTDLTTSMTSVVPEQLVSVDFHGQNGLGSEISVAPRKATLTVFTTSRMLAMTLSQAGSPWHWQMQSQTSPMLLLLASAWSGLKTVGQ